MTVRIEKGYIIKEIPLKYIGYRWDYKDFANKIVWSDWHRTAEELLWGWHYNNVPMNREVKWWRKLELMLGMLRSIETNGMENPLVCKLSDYEGDYHTVINEFEPTETFPERNASHTLQEDDRGYFVVIGNQRLVCLNVINRQFPEKFAMVESIMSKAEDNWKDNTEGKMAIGYRPVEFENQKW